MLRPDLQRYWQLRSQSAKRYKGEPDDDDDFEECEFEHAERGANTELPASAPDPKEQKSEPAKTEAPTPITIIESEDEDGEDDDDRAMREAADVIEATVAIHETQQVSWTETVKTVAHSIQMDIRGFFGLTKSASVPARPSPAKPTLKRAAASERTTPAAHGKYNSGQYGAGASEQPKRQCPFYKRLPNTTFTVDAFSYGAIENCNAYFLSHFHSDHYHGLSRGFPGGPIYCSEVTAALVKMRLNVPAEKIRTLPLETPTMIEGVSVTFLEANHCPGAVVILFVLPNGTTVLHTGDFRASTALAEHPCLASARVDTLYLDTTYCDHNYAFPPQQDVIDKSAAVCLDAFLSNPRTLFVVGAYLIGKEKIFLAIAEAVGAKIWADPNKRRVLNLLRLPRLSALLCDNKAEANVHVVDMNSLSLQKLESYLSANPHCTAAVAIRPTGWTQTQGAADLEHLKPQKRGRVTLYGMVLPLWVLTACRDALFRTQQFHGAAQKVRPKKVIPTVNVGSPAKRAQMTNYFQQWLGY